MNKYHFHLADEPKMSPGRIRNEGNPVNLMGASKAQTWQFRIKERPALVALIEWTASPKRNGRISE